MDRISLCKANRFVLELSAVRDRRVASSKMKLYFGTISAVKDRRVASSKMKLLVHLKLGSKVRIDNTNQVVQDYKKALLVVCGCAKAQPEFTTSTSDTRYTRAIF